LATRDVPPVQHQRVAVGIVEESHVADARVEGLATELDALALELAARRGDVGDPQRDVVRVRREGQAHLLGLPDAKRDLPASDLEPAGGHVAVERQADRLEVELSRALNALRRDRQEVDALDDHYPTEPSIWSWIRRFISTAYSSGSSFVIGSTKPDTTIAEASASESPRDIR